MLWYTYVQLFPLKRDLERRLGRKKPRKIYLCNLWSDVSKVYNLWWGIWRETFREGNLRRVRMDGLGVGGKGGGRGGYLVGSMSIRTIIPRRLCVGFNTYRVVNIIGTFTLIVDLFCAIIIIIININMGVSAEILDLEHWKKKREKGSPSSV